MKTITLIALLSVAAFATDYSSMSISQLQALRGNVPTADLTAFQSAMQTKVQALSIADRQALQSSMAQSNLASSAAVRAQMQTGQTMGTYQGSMSGQQGFVGSPTQVGQTMGARQGAMGGGRMH